MTFHDVSWRFIYVLTYTAREGFRWRGTSPADVLGRLLVRAARSVTGDGDSVGR